MFFELNGKTYFVKFSYNGTTTYAQFYTIETNGQPVLLENGLGIAKLYHKDKFDENKGRKVALADLLYQYSVPDGDGEIPEGLSVEDRTTIWNAYFESFRR